jgi:predicted porin
MPLVSAFRWDTGIQAHWAAPRADAAVSLTNGTLSNPRLQDDNDGKQVSGRLGVTPVTGLTLGLSAARGAWAAREIPGADNAVQQAVGADAEYSRAQWLIRGELVHCRWTMPYPLAPADTDAVSATAAWVEGRYRITPRIFAAARADTLAFSAITGTLFRGQPTDWDAPVQRVEIVAGYYLQRNLVARVAAQKNWRDGGRVRERTYISGQLSYWF